MTEMRQAEQLLRGYLADGPAELSERTYAALRARIERTPQGRAWPWSAPRSQDRRRLVLIAAVVGGLALVSVQLIRGLNPEGPGVTPKPTDSPPAQVLPATPGALDAGRYVTTPLDDVVPRPVSFSLPEGWIQSDWALTKANLYLTFWTVDTTYADPCRWQSTAVELGPTVADLTTALRAQIGRNTTVPTEISIDGRRGQYVQLDWPAGIDPAACDGGEYRLWLYGADASRANTMGFNSYIWIVDVDGLRMAIEADAQGDTAAARLAEVETIIASIDFDLPAAGVSVGDCTLSWFAASGPSAALEPPYRVTMSTRRRPMLGPVPEPFPFEPPEAQMDVLGEGWAGGAGPDRPGVRLFPPPGVAERGFATFQLVDRPQGSFVMNAPGTWLARVSARNPGCATIVPIEVLPVSSG